MASALELFKNHKKLLEEELEKELMKEKALELKIQEAKDRLRRAEQTLEELEPRKYKLTDDIENVEALTESTVKKIAELEENAKEFARENTYIFSQGDKEITQLEHRLETLTRSYETKNAKLDSYHARREIVAPRLQDAEKRLETARAKEKILERKLEGGKYKLRVSEQMREYDKRKERNDEGTIDELEWNIKIAQMRYDMAITRIKQLEEVVKLKQKNLVILKHLRERTFKENFIRKQNCRI